MNKIKNILFLGYDRDETCLIELLEKRNISVMHSNLPIEDIPEYELIISFGYRHIISKRILHKIKIPVINLHISFLPWNKGAHPLFWSFYDGTPCGVSIHMLDEGIDTGEIIYQKIVDINPKISTFREAHNLLIQDASIIERFIYIPLLFSV